MVVALHPEMLCAKSDEEKPRVLLKSAKPHKI